jgi:hypothetical protein
MTTPLIVDGSFAQLVFGEIFLNHVATNVTHVQITMEQFEAGTYLFSNSISLTQAMVSSLCAVSGLTLHLPSANNTRPPLNHRGHS